MLFFGTLIASIAYILVGLFGYVTFSMRPNVDELFKNQNILTYYPDLPVVEANLLGVLFVVTFAMPFSLIPLKDAIE